MVYAFNGASVVARRESDGTLLWTWTSPTAVPGMQTMALTNNILFVGTSTYSPLTGVTYAIDLASHLPVWSYPMSGGMALSKDGALYIVQGGKVAAIALR